MLKTKLAKLLYLCGLGLLLVALLPATASNSKGIGAMLADKNPSPYRKVAANSNDVATIKKLQEAGAIELTPPEYREDLIWGTTTLWNVPVEQMQRLSAEAKLYPKDKYDKLFVNGIEFYPLAGEPPIPDNLRQSKRDGKQMWMLHYLQPREMQVHNWLGERGISIVKNAGFAGLVVWVDGEQLAELEAAVNPEGPILWTGPYHPYYRLDADIRDYVTKLAENSSEIVKVNVLLHRHVEVEQSRKKLLNLAVGEIIWNHGTEGEEFLPVVGHDLALPAKELVNIANWYDTYSISLYHPMQLLDEMQGQLLAGNVADTPPLRPGAPGYLAWLQQPARGFGTNPTDYPVVGVIDSGFDTGVATTGAHPDFYQLGNVNSGVRRVQPETCTPDNFAWDATGHGTLVAGVIGGYNDLGNPPAVDGAGYRYGLGISPFGRLVSMRIYLQQGVLNAGLCGGTFGGAINRTLATNSATKIINLSSGAGASGYSGFSNLYDTYTRGGPTYPDKPQLFTVAVGNTGTPNGSSINTPADAKNVIAVGATMSSREPGVPTSPNCASTDSGDANEVAGFSSRGTTQDERAKPDLVAPGVHIQGPASQAAIFNGSGICGVYQLRYYPIGGQQLYTWANGTSFAAPAVAGAAQLLFNYYKRVLDPGKEPSPAMAKALLINSARYLTGGGAGDSLPSPTQGWGMINLGTLFGYTPNNTFVLDQSHIFAGTGGVAPVQFYGRVADKTKPVRFSLVWTDAPSQTRCNPCLVNNLDLQVNMLNGRVYRGNVFDTQFSETGGSADELNNVENVYLAADNANDRFVVVIRPTNLRGDGVPGNGFLRDQDFALVIHNAADVVPTGLSTTFERQTVSVNDGSGGNGNNAPEPGELIYLAVPLKNTGSEDAVAVNSQLSLNPPQPNVTLVEERSDYPDIVTSATITNQTPFSFRLEPAFDCGTPVTLSQATIYNGSVAASSSFTVATGSFGLGTPHVHSNNTPRTIANDTTTVSTILVSDSVSGRVAKLRLTLDILHNMNNELRVNLIAPNGKTALLFSGIGGTQGFQNITFDDAASHTLSEIGSPQPNHTYKPPVPFSEALNDTSTGLAPTLAGTWQLEIQHTQYTITRTGSLQSWSLSLQRNDESVCLPFTPAAAKYVTAQDGTPQSGAIGTVFLPLQVRVTDTKGNPIRGIPVTFQAPANGPSGTFPNGSRTLVVNTDVDGLATANSLRANNQPGGYLVTAGIGVSGASPAQFALTNVAGEATSLTIASGNQQGTLPNSPFGAPLVVQLRDSAGNPVAGQGVTFTPPDTRAGGVAGGEFSGTPDIEGSSWTVFTDNSGRATAPTLTANGIAGNYVVVASSGQLSTNFSLHNLTACPNGINPFVVTSASDDGSGLSCGTLSRALLQAVSGTTISFSLGGTSTVAIAGSLPPVRAGVTLSGGSSCGASLLTLSGTGTTDVGLRLEGGATLQNLRIRGFGQPQIEASNAGSGGNHLLCVRVQH